jgi:predicted nucleic acid-binding protein
MHTVIDANALIHLLDPRSDQTMRDRVRGLLLQIQSARTQLIIPTPVITEYLSEAGAAGPAILEALTRNRYVTVAPFDHKAAVECAEMDRAAKSTGNKRSPLPVDAKWQKVKVDRQVVAIAKAWAAEIVAEDQDIMTIARAAGVPCRRVSALPLPGSLAQLHLPGVAAPPGPHQPGQMPK